MYKAICSSNWGCGCAQNSFNTAAAISNTPDSLQIKFSCSSRLLSSSIRYRGDLTQVMREECRRISFRIALFHKLCRQLAKTRLKSLKRCARKWVMLECRAQRSNLYRSDIKIWTYSILKWRQQSCDLATLVSRVNLSVTNHIPPSTFGIDRQLKPADNDLS